MDWHSRYMQQASWTRQLREYLLSQAAIDHADRVLEVGCGTGAVLMDLAQPVGRGGAHPLSIHGLDIRAHALSGARRHVPSAVLTCGDAHRLPYAHQRFDITFCHFLLLWLDEPARAIGEMRRVTRSGGHVMALAEPDYMRRLDHPPEFEVLGRWQRDALIAQGADPSIGSSIADLFKRQGLKIVEAGTLAPRAPGQYADADWQGEWAVLREDVSARVSEEELDRLEELDRQARRSGERRMSVPTYFVDAQV